MLVYYFTVYDEYAKAPVETTAASLPDEDSAWEYGEAIIRDLLRRDPKQSDSRVMVVTCGERVITSIAFDLAALRIPRALQ